MPRVAIIGDNSVEFVDILLENWNRSNCVVIIDSRVSLTKACAMMEEASVKTCYIEQRFFKDANIDTKIEFIIYERHLEQASCLPHYVSEKYIPRYTHEEAVIIYSSGTTGKSRGIILTHYAISVNADAIIDYMKPQVTDCLYIVKTFAHSSTLTGELLVALKAKIRIVISPTVVHPRYVFDNIRKFGVTVICVNPTLLSMYMNEYSKKIHDISSLKVIYVSGAILNDEIYNKSRVIFNNLPVYNVYGLSEVGPRVTAQRYDCCKSNSVGKVIKNVELCVVDMKGNPVNEGENGIIHVNSPSLFKGYVVGNTKNESLYQSWFNTGDIGYIDKNQELHITGRSDDVIIINAHKIYPSDVENFIIKQFDVTECCVVKIIRNNVEFLACLYVSSNDIGGNMRGELTSSLMSYEIPQIFRKCSSLPKTYTGKVLRSEVTKILEKGL